MVTLSEEQSGGDWRGLGDGLNTGNEGEPLAQAVGLVSQGWTGLHGVSGTRGPRSECIPGSPGVSGLVSRGSQGLRSPLESRRGSLGAP